MFSFDEDSIARLLRTKCHVSAKVYLCILFQSNNSKSQISVRKIASLCSVSEVTAIKALRELRGLHLLNVRPQRNPNRANIYELNRGCVQMEPKFFDPEPARNSFQEWLRTGLTPEVYRKVREIYGVGMSQESLKAYFAKYVEK